MSHVLDIERDGMISEVSLESEEEDEEEEAEEIADEEQPQNKRVKMNSNESILSG